MKYVEYLLQKYNKLEVYWTCTLNTFIKKKGKFQNYCY